MTTPMGVKLRTRSRFRYVVVRDFPAKVYDTGPRPASAYIEYRTDVRPRAITVARRYNTATVFDTDTGEVVYLKTNTA